MSFILKFFFGSSKNEEVKEGEEVEKEEVKDPLCEVEIVKENEEEDEEDTQDLLTWSKSKRKRNKKHRFTIR